MIGFTHRVTKHSASYMQLPADVLAQRQSVEKSLSSHKEVWGEDMAAGIKLYSGIYRATHILHTVSHLQTHPILQATCFSKIT